MGPSILEDRSIPLYSGPSAARHLATDRATDAILDAQEFGARLMRLPELKRRFLEFFPEAAQSVVDWDAHDFVQGKRKLRAKGIPRLRFTILRLWTDSNPECRDQIFERRAEFTRLTGWYPYVTGMPADGRVEAMLQRMPTDGSSSTDRRGISQSLALGRPIALHYLPDESAAGGTGRAFMIETNACQIVLDTGYNARQISRLLDHEKPAIVVVSHAHADHSGGLPTLLEELPGLIVLANPLTAQIVALNWVSWEVNHDRLGRRLDLLGSSLLPVRNGDSVAFSDGASIRFWDANHIPGSLMTDLQFGNGDGIRVLYSGDFKLRNDYGDAPLRLLTGIDSPLRPCIDIGVFDGGLTGQTGTSLGDADATGIRNRGQRERTLIEDINAAFRHGACLVVVLGNWSDHALNAYLEVFDEFMFQPPDRLKPTRDRNLHVFLEDSARRLLWATIRYYRQEAVKESGETPHHVKLQQFLEAGRNPCSSYQLFDMESPQWMNNVEYDIRRKRPVVIICNTDRIKDDPGVIALIKRPDCRVIVDGRGATAADVLNQLGKHRTALYRNYSQEAVHNSHDDYAALFGSPQRVRISKVFFFGGKPQLDSKQAGSELVKLGNRDLIRHALDTISPCRLRASGR